MDSLPSLSELGLLRQHTGFTLPPPAPSYSPWWTTLEGDADDNVFRGHKIVPRDDRPRKRRALSPDSQDKPTLALALPVPADDDEDVPELEDSLDDSPKSSPEPSPEPSPQTSPQTSPETAAADLVDLALPIRRLLPPHYLLPLPVARKEWDVEARRARQAEARQAEARQAEARAARETREKETEKEKESDRDRDAKRKRDAPARLKMANLLAPTPHVYCLYKFDRVDQLGGKRRGMR